MERAGRNVTLKMWDTSAPLGYVLGNGPYGGGGLIGDHNGDWIIGFSRNLGFTDSFITELWVLRDGLTLAREHNLNSLILEMDAMAYECSPTDE